MSPHTSQAATHEAPCARRESSAPSARPPGRSSSLEPPSRRLSAAFVVASLVSFASPWVALLGLAGWLTWSAAGPPFGAGEPHTIALRALAAVGAALAWAILLRGLAWRAPARRTDLVEVTEDEQPELFGTLRRLAARTGAPMPRRVHLSADANAAVLRDPMFGVGRTARAPTRSVRADEPGRERARTAAGTRRRHELVIGLALLDALDRGELDSVLAHELAHLAQRGAALGGAVSAAHRLWRAVEAPGGDGAGDEKGDDGGGAERGRRRARPGRPPRALSAPLRASLAVWRALLGGIYRLLRRLDARLLRALELDADRAAVEAAGSEAMVGSLVRSRFAELCLAQTLTDLQHAADRGLATRDLFAHLPATAAYLRRFHRSPTMGVPPEGCGEPSVRLFSPDGGRRDGVCDQGGCDAHRDADRDGAVAAAGPRWDSHPTDAARERGAKSPAVSRPRDRRSAWTILRRPEQLRRQVSARALDRLFGLRPSQLAAPAVVQRFLDDERAETTFDPGYGGRYEGRLLAPGSLGRAFAAPEAADLRATLRERDTLWSAGAPVDGSPPGRSSALAASGADVPPIADELDRRVLRLHVALAKRLDREDAAEGRPASRTGELRRRYEAQLAIQALGGSVAALRARALTWSTSSEGFERALDELLARAGTVRLPSLCHVEEGESLRAFLEAPAELPAGRRRTSRDRGVDHHHDGDAPDAGRRAPARRRAALYEDRLSRLFFKNLGGLLRFQEELARQASRRGAAGGGS